jgi:hypothetical protein
MVTFIHRFARFDHKREYSTRLIKQKFNRDTIEAFNKKKERFLDYIIAHIWNVTEVIKYRFILDDTRTNKQYVILKLI